MQRRARGVMVPGDNVDGHVVQGLRELRYIELYSARKIRNLRIGPYTSPLRGPGFDFDEHRLYRPGEDVRRIDWNVTARMNAPYLRQTHAERELNVVAALDLSPSMAFGSSRYSKKEVMTFIAASIVFSATSDQINLGFLAFADRVLQWAPPRRAGGRAWRLLEELWDLEPTGSRTSTRRRSSPTPPARVASSASVPSRVRSRRT